MAEFILVKRKKYAGDILTELLKAGWDMETAIQFVDNLPDVDEDSVRHGRWVDAEDDGGGTLWHCSKCYKPVKTFCLPPNYNYCPNCGAKMDGGTE